jgi:hypothetical protein
MSQNSDEEDSPAEPRRGRRKKKLSQRAADAIQAHGEVIPGISPKRAQSPDNDPNAYHPLLSTAQAQPSARIPNMANQSKIAKLPPPKARAKPIRTSAEHYELGPDQFAIYFWQTPIPKDFLDLPDSRKSWKARIDRVEKQKDLDDGADDWQGFNNNLANRSIASCFMKRAKRAFWARKSWKEFENQERSLSSVTVDARGRPDPEALDNDRRMEIFEVIKVRLCEEIWLEPYVPEVSKKDSKSPIPANSGVRSNTPNAVDNEPEPSKEERTDGIVRRTRNREGAAEPWYEGETINPSGIQNGIRDCQDRHGPVAKPPSDQTFQQERRRERVVPVIRNIGTSGPVGLSSVEEAVAGAPDFSTSDEDN